MPSLSKINTTLRVGSCALPSMLRVSLVDTSNAVLVETRLAGLRPAKLCVFVNCLNKE
nr:MAG TPA: hypothetical protein [Caudoviricetes sp.]